jgi:hypothetical protein
MERLFCMERCYCTYRNLAAVHLATISALELPALAASTALTALAASAALDLGAVSRLRLFLFFFGECAALELASKVATGNSATASNAGIEMLHWVQRLCDSVVLICLF